MMVEMLGEVTLFLSLLQATWFALPADSSRDTLYLLALLCLLLEPRAHQDIVN